MIEVNNEAQASLESFEYKIDISNYVREATDLVKGKTFEGALRTLILLYTSPPLEVLRQHVGARTSEIAELLAAHETINDSGQVIARRPSLLSINAELREHAIIAEMFSVANVHRGLFVQAQLHPALYQMRQEHQLVTSDWMHLIRYSPFVPEDRVLLFARGFQAGWNNEWDLATHLLVPQVENSIRYILTANGSLASALHPTGIQSEQGLDQTLKKSELTQILPEALVFDLRGLLIEKTGSYLRHRTSHGLASFVDFYAAPSLYLWWLTLRLCLLPLLSTEASAEAPVAAPTESEGDSDAVSPSINTEVNLETI